MIRASVPAEEAAAHRGNTHLLRPTGALTAIHTHHA
jgi:hypothetical protein